MFLGDQHQQEKVVDSEIYDSTKDQQQQLLGSKVDSKIYDSTKDHEQQSPGSMVDLEISALMKDSSELPMSDSFFDNRMETIINAGFKNSSTCLKSLSCNFPMEKYNIPELAILHLSQAYLNNKCGKKTHYYDLFVVGQAIPMLNPPEDLEDYVPEEDEVKILRPKYDGSFWPVLRVVETLAYLTVRGDKRVCFLGQGYDIDNNKILYTAHKMKILNNFNAIIFDRRKNDYKQGARAFSDTDFSKTFFFLLFVK